MRGAIGSVLRRAAGCPPIVRHGSRRRAEIALTFDDGPSEWTEAIAATLAAHGCRGTFFVLGGAVEREPDAAAALARAGHELGNHLFSHTDPATQSRDEIRREIASTSTAIAAASGATPALVRPPYCGAPHRVAWAARGSRYVVLRSIDPADWRATGPNGVINSVLGTATAGDIVCLHDGLAPVNNGSASRQPTVAAVEQLVPALLDRGLRLVTVSELLR